MSSFFCLEPSRNSDSHPVPKLFLNRIVAKQRVPIWNADYSEDIPVMTMTSDKREGKLFYILF